MSTSKLMMIDEYHLVLARQDTHDRVRRQLREIIGVPNAAYITSETRVFVFDKLVRLVVDQGIDPLTQPVQVLDLIPHAWTCPDEAVRLWGVKPVGYRLEPLKGERAWQIKHEAFHACLPATFLSKSAALDALARLLMGQTFGEWGNLYYLSQPLISMEDALPALPEMPALELPDLPVSGGSRWLRKNGWIGGLSAITQNVYEQCLEIEERWRDRCEQMQAFINVNADRLKTLVSSMSLEVKGDMPYPLDANELAQAEDLRALYPELEGLTTAWLWHKLEDFSTAQGYRSIIAVRDERFVLYLMGQFTVPKCTHYSAEEIGGWVAYLLLQGHTFEQAAEKATALYAYNQNLSTRCMYIQRAVQFMKQEADRKLRRDAINAGRPIHEIGKEIFTAMDFLHSGRKTGVAAKVVVQSIADFKFA